MEIATSAGLSVNRRRWFCILEDFCKHASTRVIKDHSTWQFYRFTNCCLQLVAQLHCTKRVQSRLHQWHVRIHCPTRRLPDPPYVPGPLIVRFYRPTEPFATFCCFFAPNHLPRRAPETLRKEVKCHVLNVYTETFAPMGI